MSERVKIKFCQKIQLDKCKKSMMLQVYIESFQTRLKRSVLKIRNVLALFQNNYRFQSGKGFPTHMQQTTFENVVTKEEIAMSPFVTMFSSLWNSYVTYICRYVPYFCLHVFQVFSSTGQRPEGLMSWRFVRRACVRL